MISDRNHDEAFSHFLHGYASPTFGGGLPAPLNRCPDDWEERMEKQAASVPVIPEDRWKSAEEEWPDIDRITDADRRNAATLWAPQSDPKDDRIRELEDRIASLEAGCVRPELDT